MRCTLGRQGTGVIIERMIMYFGQDVFFEMEELETYIFLDRQMFRVLSASQPGVRVITQGAEDFWQWKERRRRWWHM